VIQLPGNPHQVVRDQQQVALALQRRGVGYVNSIRQLLEGVAEL
jgi:hypothetical protein